jgi:hypothetical protein
VKDDEYKTALTPNERIKAAYLYHIRGIPMHDIAVAFEVNHGRVAEACTAIWEAAKRPKEIARSPDETVR